MSSYLYPIEKALIQFPIIAFIFTIPFILYNYRRYGSISFVRSFVLFTFIFYLQCAFYLVVLPLPNPSVALNNTGNFMQLVPFNFIREFIDYSSFNYKDLSTIFIAIKESVFTQPLFNVFLTIPFGVYLGYYFKQDIRKVLVYSVLLSLFFEITQLTGIYGFYSRPYRLFDVDDIFLNTLGGVFGCLINRFVGIFLPSREEIDIANLKKSEKVGYVRRTVGVLIDFLFVTAVTVLITNFVSLNNLDILFIFYLYFVLGPVIFKGKTLGKKFVNLKLVVVDSSVSLFIHLLVRYGFIYFLIIGIQSVMNFRLLFIVMISFLLSDLILSSKRNKRLWYEMLSKTKYESEIYYKDELNITL